MTYIEKTTLKTPALCGIVNVTPDSFSDGGKWENYENAVNRGMELARQGAQILDIGGESTRPGARLIPASEEIQRIAPVVKTLKAKTEALISVDTWKAEVAKAALEAGADIINDITGFAGDKKMPDLIAGSGCGVVLMANAVVVRQGESKSSASFFLPELEGFGHFFDEATRRRMSELPILELLLAYLKRSTEIARKAGIAESQILIDPGLGFGLSGTENLEVLKSLNAFEKLAFPLFVGFSRKRFVAEVLESLDLPSKTSSPLGIQNRDYASAIFANYAIAGGAKILRVHSLPEHKISIEIAKRVLN